MDKQEVRKIAEATLAKFRCAPGDEIIILDQYTREKPYGWIFFYNSREYLATHNLRYVLVGTGPLVVDRETGRADFVGTAQGPDIMIADFEERRYGRRFGREETDLDSESSPRVVTRDDTLP